MIRQPLFTVVISCNLLLAGCAGSATKQSSTKQELPARIVGGGCDGCELMYIGMPERLAATDTSAGWREEGQRLLVSGTVFKKDGKTPAPNVILYYWQTDHNGYYSPKPGLDPRAARHGHIRGWVKTDNEGRYALYTIRPAPYPNETMPAHIHISVKEPGLPNEYFIDELVFDDDPFLTPEKRKQLENRGGSGILTITDNGGLKTALHDIVLGLNIPDYPEQK